MRVFRLSQLAYIADPLSGIGAAQAGARWNSKGTRMGYTAGSRSLSLLELLVHVGRTQVPKGLVMVPIEVPDNVVAELERLPAGWDELPYSSAVQATGDLWIKAVSSLALRVPSAIVREEFNILVNPLHPDFGAINIGKPEPMVWDERLFWMNESLEQNSQV